MKECELCQRPARMYCESDQASLCWTCDANVHSANFLVARHTRSLLCQACQAPTPWRAAGARLGPTVSVCQKCVGSEDESSGHGRGHFGTSTTVSMKRRREDEDFLHQEMVGRSSSQANYDTSEDGELSPTPSRAPKDRKITSGEGEAVTVSRTKLAGTLRITQNERWKRVERTSTAVGTCSRREESLSAVDLVSDGSESRPM
ncbi:putative zinc finger protein CONSTANS-LIKE 11 [Nymphaea thermarum]|nr:putative zinc finger protein CONSTANS-LIKE 11 [Nymphaea thermarum]